MKMNIYRTLLFPAIGCLALSSCFKDEAQNTECDIQQAYVQLTADSISKYFEQPSDTLVNVNSTQTSVVFQLKDGVSVGQMAPLFRLTPGATISPENGSTFNFSNGMMREYTVTSEDGQWQRTYLVGFGEAIRIPTKFSFENIDLYYEDGVAKYQVFYDLDETGKRISDWATGNAGYKLSNGSALPEEYPTVQADGGVSGKCAKLTTRSTGQFGEWTNRRLAAGNLFIGEFDVLKALTATMQCTRFGLPFKKRPLTFRGWYKYKAGDTFQDKQGKTVSGRTDRGDIYAVLYKNHDENGAALVLNGDNVKTSPDIVALAEVGTIGDTQEWTQFEATFNYTADFDYNLLLRNGYSLAIVCTSSTEGANFEGAVGSTLYVDEFELVCE